jgi:UDP-galactose transporter
VRLRRIPLTQESEQLTAHSSASILLVHYSRIMPPISSHRYLASTAVFLSELLKLAACLTISLYEISRTAPPSAPVTSLLSSLFSAIFSGDSWKFAIPASLYTLANSLTYIGIGNLDAATFQVTCQLKILATALFSSVILGRGLGVRKWVALLLLTWGVAIVQMGIHSPGSEQSVAEATRMYLPRSFDFGRLTASTQKERFVKRSATYEGIAEDEMMENPRLNSTLGLLAVIASSIASGAAGVYFEKILKDSVKPTSLWIRNVQLAIYSLFPALFIGVVFLDGETIAKHGFFQGYNWVVWLVVTVQALGGIIVAFCIYYADNIAKNFSTSISIVISALASFWFFEFETSGNVRLPLCSSSISAPTTNSLAVPPRNSNSPGCHIPLL